MSGVASSARCTRKSQAPAFRQDVARLFALVSSICPVHCNSISIFLIFPLCLQLIQLNNLIVRQVGLSVEFAIARKLGSVHSFSLLRFFDVADCGFNSRRPYTPRFFFHIGIGSHSETPGPSLLWRQFRSTNFFLFSRILHSVLMYTKNKGFGRDFLYTIIA
jgi:hypothetical protein